VLPAGIGRSEPSAPPPDRAVPRLHLVEPEDRPPRRQCERILNVLSRGAAQRRPRRPPDHADRVPFSVLPGTRCAACGCEPGCFRRKRLSRTGPVASAPSLTSSTRACARLASSGTVPGRSIFFTWASTAAITSAASSFGTRQRMVAVPWSSHRVTSDVRSAAAASTSPSRLRRARHSFSSCSASSAGPAGSARPRWWHRPPGTTPAPARTTTARRRTPRTATAGQPGRAPPPDEPEPSTPRWPTGSTTSGHTSRSPRPPTPPADRTRPAAATTGTSPPPAARPAPPAHPPRPRSAPHTTLSPSSEDTNRRDNPRNDSAEDLSGSGRFGHGLVEAGLLQGETVGWLAQAIENDGLRH
jgi:hypothetical protein